MSTAVRFYSIAFENRETKPFDFSIADFFQNIEELLTKPETRHCVLRDINGKIIRCFTFYKTDKNFQISVIPFGKLKDKNKPYWVNAASNKLEEIPQELFDINSLAYDHANDVMLLTTNREGPDSEQIQDYLNSFIPKEYPIKIVIRPIFYNTGIEKIRNARLVRSVTINLDLGNSLNKFYNEQIDLQESKPLTRAFKDMVENAKQEGQSRTLSLVLGLGTSKKEATLDRDSILNLLEDINIQEDFVKEIIVNYKNGESEKVDTAKLKNSNIILSHSFGIVGSQIAPEYLLNNMDDAISSQRNKFRQPLRTYLESKLPFNFDVLQLVLEWDPAQYYK